MKKIPPKPKIIVIVGQTSSGKSELAVRLAKAFSGEIVSADSRQVYRGMDLGTGKISGKWLKKKLGGHKPDYIYKHIVHHGIDIANPKKQFSVAEFKEYTDAAIKDAISGGRVPIICGGSGHWIDAVVFNQLVPKVLPNKKLRESLEKKTTAELFGQLKKLDPGRARKIDKNNPRRLIRALEIVLATKKPIPKLESNPAYRPLWIGLRPDRKQLYKRIEKRLNERLQNGMLAEVKKLHAQGISWKKLKDFGLEYKYCALYLQKKLNYEEMHGQLLFAIKHYAKRQETWWKKNQNINWKKKEAEISPLVKKFLSKN